MNLLHRLCRHVVLAVILSMLGYIAAPAQGPARMPVKTAATADPTALPDAPAPPPAAAESNGWRGTASIYGWFPGTHGTVGVLGHEAGIHASFSDIFHYLKGVIPIAVEADKGRFVMPIVPSGATFTEQTVAVDCSFSSSAWLSYIVSCVPSVWSWFTFGNSSMKEDLAGAGAP